MRSLVSESGGFRSFLRKLRAKGFRGIGAYLACRAFPLQEALLESYFEWWLDVRTRGEISPQALGHRDTASNGYQATFYASNLAIFERLDRRGSDDVFIDFGSGKGRVVLLAARHPYRRVIGIEFSSDLNAIARRNIEAARRHLRCHQVDFFEGDARTFQIPDEANVFYFANPFYGDALEAVLDKIRLSLEEAPRPITLISHSHAPKEQFERQIRECPWLEVREEVRLQCFTNAWIYTNRFWREPQRRVSVG